MQMPPLAWIYACSPPLRDLSSVRQWDWGSPSLAALYRGLDRCCRGNSYVQGYDFLVEVCLLLFLAHFLAFDSPTVYYSISLPQFWAYEHRVLEQPSLVAPGEVVYPVLTRWGESTVSHDVGTHRARLKELVWDMVRSDSQPFLSFIFGVNMS